MGRRRLLGLACCGASAIVLALGLWLSSHVPAGAGRHDAQTTAFRCLGLGAIGVLGGLILAGSAKQVRVLVVDEEMRSTARTHGVKRALHEAGLADTKLVSPPDE